MSIRTLILFFLLGSPAVAQSYHVHTYSENDGLPSSAIRDVEQDGSGRMWLATRAGLARYDGVEWAVQDDGRADPVALAFDESGLLWSVAHHRLAVTRHDPETIGAAPPHRLPEPAAADVGGEVLTLAATGPSERTRVAVGTRGGLFLWDGEEWRTPGGGLPAEEIRGLAAAGGRFYAATAGAVGEIGEGGWRRFAGPFRSPRLAEFLALALDAEGTPWVMGRRPGAGRAWLGRVEGQRVVLVAADLPLPGEHLGHPRLTLLAAGSSGGSSGREFHGHFYYGNPADLFHLRLDARAALSERLRTASGLIARGVSALHHDREGNVWVGSPRGLSKIVSLRFANWDQAHGLLENEVTAVFERRDGSFVLGHSLGLSLLDSNLGGERPATLPFEDLPRDRGFQRVLDLAEDDRGRLWIAASGLGLARLDQSGELDWYRQRGPRIAYSVHVDRQQTVWAASNEAVYRLADDRFEFVSADFEGHLRRLAEGDSGRFWVLGDRGLYRRDGEDWSGPFTGGSPRASNVFALLDESRKSGGEGVVWVGTLGGLYRLHGDRLEKSTTPAVERPVYFLLRDSRGDLWIGTDNGVMRFDGARLHRYTARDGLSGRETNRAAGLADRHGRVWIGTDRGVSIYRTQYERPLPPPELELRGVEAGGTLYDFDGELALEPWQHDLTFHFRALSFLDERRILYRCRLQGYDEEWLPPSPRPEIRYTNLAPGRYRLEVRAANAAGVWSEVVATPEIVLVPPFWRRAWFFPVLGALLLGVGFLAVHLWNQRLYARRLEREVGRRTAELRREVAERRRLEREAMRHRQLEALGNLAGGLAHDYNNLLTAVLGNLNLIELEGPAARAFKPLLAGARDAALRARELTQRLLTFARGGAPVRHPAPLYDLIDDVSSTLGRRFPAVTFEVDVDREQSWSDIDPGQIREVLDGLLRNAAEAMPGGGVIEIRGARQEVAGAGADGGENGGTARAASASVRDAARFVLEVEDHGVGISPHDLERIFEPYFTTKAEGSGLSLAAAHSIAEQHGGSLSARSEVGQGSVFCLELPAAAPEFGDYDTVEVDPALLAAASRTAGRRRVLVMDDEEVVRLVVVRMLGKLGYTATGAASGEEALELFTTAARRGEPFAAVILDLIVPGGMGGRETLERLRELDPDVRAVVCSGYSNDPVMARFAEHGFRAVLPKPFRLPALMGAMEKIFE